MAKGKGPKDRLNRRQFLEKAGKLGGAVFLSSLAGKALAGEWEQAMEELWTNGSFIHDTVDASMEAQGLIRALLDGNWREFRTVPLPQDFMDWNLSARLEVLENISMMFSGEGGSPPSLAGPHNAAMATYGGRRADSVLTVNNAFKGMGLCPNREIIKDKMARMEELMSGGMGQRLDFLQDLYSSPDNFDLTKMISLELYSTPDFETHTFINLMERPVTSLVFLDSRSYEVRGIGQLVPPEDTGGGEYASDIVKYTNMAHSFFHGDFPRLYPGILVHVTAVFDNSPGSGRGVRIAPPLV